jgi:hypothetical protein
MYRGERGFRVVAESVSLLGVDLRNHSDLSGKNSDNTVFIVKYAGRRR